MLLNKPSRRFVVLCLLGSLLLGRLVESAKGNDNLEVRQKIWQQFVAQISSASPEQERAFRKRAESMGMEYFQGRQQDDAKEVNLLDHLQNSRLEADLNLPTRKCGEIIANLSVSDLKDVAKGIVNNLFPSNSTLEAFAPVALELLSSTLKYPIQVQKICSSCGEIQNFYQGESFLHDTSTYGFATFCGKDRYGYNVTTSGLLLLPIDPSTGKVFTKTLRSAVFTHGTTSGSQRAPSGVFPSNITATLQATGTQELKNIAALLDVIPALFGASAGAVLVMPDNIGYGESYQSPKSYLVYSLYQQASVTLWLAARRMLLSVSSPKSLCTALDHVVSVTGYSEGGYSSFSTCLALNQLSVAGSKVRVSRCQCGGTPFDLDYVISFNLEQLKNKTAHPLAPALPIFFGNSYSSTNPDLVNSNKNQDALKAGYKRLAPIWLDSPSIEALVALSDAIGPLTSLTKNIVQLYTDSIGGQSVARPCSGTGLQNAETNLLCQAIVDNILVNPLLSADFPTVVCHARDDHLVPFGNIPNFSSNPNVQFYQPEVPQLTPTGNHQGGAVYCTIGAILAFSTPSNSEDSLQYMSNLPSTNVCKMQTSHQRALRGQF